MPSQPEYLEQIRTLAEWQSILIEKLISMGVGQSRAKSITTEHVSTAAASNLNAMVEVRRSKILYDLFVQELFRKVQEMPAQPSIKKLSAPQLRLLGEICERPMHVVDYYEPAKVLVRLGLAERDQRMKLTATPLGRTTYESQKPD
jgi:hypothetical protein